MKSHAIIAAGALALAMTTAHAGPVNVYQSTAFQGVTFKFMQVDADTLSFNISGTLGGDWATAKYLGAFDLKDLGVDFSTTTAKVNGPGATNLAGQNDQLSGANLLCSGGGSPPGGICFNISPDFALSTMPMDLTYTIDFSSALNITTSVGPHLQIAWLANAGDTRKVGSLYSQNIVLSSTVTTVPEPGSLALAAMALALAAGAFGMRRQS